MANTSTITGSGPTVDGSELLDEDDPTQFAESNVYQDKTLVLICGGPEQRDPSDPVDLRSAVAEPGDPIRGNCGPEGPAWQAGDLYTSARFAAQRQFAEQVTQWTDKAGWAIITPEHGVVEPYVRLKPHQTTVTDLGGNELEADHRVDSPVRKRRPDGREIVTERDVWATRAAYGLMKWIAAHRPKGGHPSENEANTLLVVGSKDRIEPLRERGVFEWGIARMSGNPNTGFKQPLHTRFLFEEVGVETRSDQLAWLSDAVDHLDSVSPDTDQPEINEWRPESESRTCDHCGAESRTSTLVAVNDEVVCKSCYPDTCARCGSLTHENGLGNYPLCPDCQTEYGGQIREEYEPDPTTQTELPTVD